MISVKSERAKDQAQGNLQAKQAVWSKQSEAGSNEEAVMSKRVSKILNEIIRMCSKAQVPHSYQQASKY